MATRREPRAPLDRDRILRAALDIADRTGIESLTMRKLGEALGFEAMSLYNHVANKDDLIDGMLDLVLAETELPPPSGDWRIAVRANAISVHESLQRHPWAAALLLSASRMRPARGEHMEWLLGQLRGAGFPAETTYHAFHVLDAHIFGFSLWQTSHAFTDEDIPDLMAAFESMVRPDESPHLYEHGQQHFHEGTHHEVSAFEFGLDLVLDGLERLKG
jgi:AcrR family transcriptional regulator